MLGRFSREMSEVMLRAQPQHPQNVFKLDLNSPLFVTPGKNVRVAHNSTGLGCIETACGVDGRSLRHFFELPIGFSCKRVVSKNSQKAISFPGEA